MTPAICVNGRFVGRPVTGVERYAWEITRRLASRVRLVTPGRPASGLRGHLWEQLVLPQRLGARDVLWSPANTGPLNVSRHAVTIHDLGPIDHPEWFNPKFCAWYRYLLPRLIRHSRRLMTSSAFFRARILSLFDVPEERVVSIPAGVCEAFRPRSETAVTAVRQKYGLSPRYALTVGSLEPRKNLRTLFEAWSAVRRRASDACLVVVGRAGRSFRSAGFRQVPQGVRLIGRVAEEDLPFLYSGAFVLLLPSLYEGFGLPLVEAMACGTPVVASNVTALPEVAGDAALLIEPTAASVAAAVLRLLDDPALTAELRRQGIKRAQAFSWERSTSRVWEVLRETAVL
jgi:glycosyltransferase involved in cell wall biosynthesis